MAGIERKEIWVNFEKQSVDIRKFSLDELVKGLSPFQLKPLWTN